MAETQPVCEATVALDQKVFAGFTVRANAADFPRHCGPQWLSQKSIYQIMSVVKLTSLSLGMC